MALEGKLTTMEQIEKTFADAQNFFQEKLSAGLKPLNEEIGRVTKDVKLALDSLKLLQQEKAARVAYDGRLVVRGGRLTGMDVFSLKLTEELARRQYALNGTCSNLINEVQAKRKDIFNAMTIDNVMEWEDLNLKKRSVNLKDGMFANAMRAHADHVSRWRRQI